MEEIRTKERLTEFRQQDGYIFNCFYPFARRFTTFGTLHKTNCPYMDEMSTEEQIYWSRKGVFFDRCYFFTNAGSKSIGGAKPFKILSDNIRTVGVESTVLGTDAGQLKNDFPTEIMSTYLKKLSEAGFSDNEIERMAVKTPAALLNLQ